jgi:hypothetical protein
MFPHKYTSPTEQARIWAWVEALSEWQKVRPLDWASMPRAHRVGHPHQNDPRVRRELIACERYYRDLWFATRNV